jgi:hypothetical protein
MFFYGVKFTTPCILRVRYIALASSYMFCPPLHVNHVNFKLLKHWAVFLTEQIDKILTLLLLYTPVTVAACFQAPDPFDFSKSGVVVSNLTGNKTVGRRSDCGPCRAVPCRALQAAALRFADLPSNGYCQPSVGLIVVDYRIRRNQEGE